MMKKKKKTKKNSKGRVSTKKTSANRRFLFLLPKPTSSPYSSQPLASPISAIEDSVGLVLANDDLLKGIISFLPAIQIPSCHFVSNAWNKATEKVPLGLRIEDRGKKHVWLYRPNWNLRKDGQSDRDEFLLPFYKIGSLPTRVRKRVTKLTLVMRMIDEHVNDYDLESMRDILKGFTNLEDLRVLSSLGDGDSFCSLFQRKNYFQRLHTLSISGYCFDIHSGLVVENEFNLRNHTEKCTRVNGSDIKDIVEAVPNLEHLEIIANAHGCNLTDLLPLSRPFELVTSHIWILYSPLYPRHILPFNQPAHKLLLLKDRYRGR